MQEAMFFVGWFWMFFELGLFHKFRAGWNPDILENASDYASWPPPSIETVDPWHLPLMNTLILLLSGTTVTWAHHALIHGDRKGAKWGLGITVALGVLFTMVQFYEYEHLFHYRLEDGLKGTFWLSTNVYGSAFFMATGFHGRHHLPVRHVGAPDEWRHERGQAFRSRSGRLVLALRRRRLAVPVRLRLRRLHLTTRRGLPGMNDHAAARP
jgi:heme/copper-type cytochrome/quinol oxidase subunit 3